MSKEPVSALGASPFLTAPEQAYKDLFDTLPDAAVILKGEAIVDVNAAGLAMMRCTREVVIGRNAYDFIHPTDAAIVRERQAKREQGEPVDHLLKEYRLLRPDGTAILVEASAVLTQDGIAITIFRDVTDRNRAAEELRTSRELLSSVVENIPIGIWVADKDFRIKLWNVGQELMTGVKREEVLGMNIFERFPSLTAAGLEGPYRRVVETGEPWSVDEFPFYDATLTKIDYYLNIKANPLKNSRGKVTGIVLAVEDITERKRAEEALGRSEAKFRSYINQSVDGIFIADGAGRYLEVNPAGCAMLGYTEEEICSKSIMDVIAPGDENLRIFQEQFEMLLRTGEAKGEEVLLRKDGTELITEIHAVTVGADRYMGLVRDITERKRAERALLKSLADLERSYALQSEFVRNMTHEVRTPLTGVVGYAQALLEGIAGDVSVEQKKVLKRILNQADSLLGIVEEILESATLAAGVQKLDLRMIRLEQVIPNIVSLSEKAAKEREIVLKMRVEPGLPVIVSDAQKLTRILNNLISNAVKFTFEGCVTVSALRTWDGVHIMVEDTGIGIPEDRQEHVFDAFVQLSYPGKHKPVGAGLGLSIVSELVDALGCSLVLSSVPGVGTAFTLRVPLRHEQME